MLSDSQFPVIACFVLFIAMMLYWSSLFFPKNQFIFQSGQSLVILSNFLFMITLASRWFTEKYFPLSNLYESLIFLSWGISTVHLYIEFQTKSRLVGSLATPLLFFLSGFSSFTLPTEMQKALPLVPSLQSNWLMMHVSMMMVSYATLLVGSLLSIFYLFYFQFGKKKEQMGKNFFLPEKKVAQSNETWVTEETSSLSSSASYAFQESNEFRKQSSSQENLLQTVDIWSYRIIGLGFPFLTIGIISGAVWANEAWGSYWSWDPKETWAFITWLVFATYLHSRLLKGWQGEKAASLGTVGFFVIWICYLGVNFLGKGLHSYGWVL